MIPGSATTIVTLLSSSDNTEVPPIDPKTNKLIKDAIKIVYHPNSKHADEIKSLYDYRHQANVSQPPIDNEPWAPFQTCGDYEYAEISLAVSLSTQQNNALIQLIHCFI